MSSITLDNNAPSWAHRFRTAIESAMENLWTRPLPLFTTTTLPSPTDRRWLWRLIAVSDGAGNKWVAISNGTTWRYLEGTAV